MKIVRSAIATLATAFALASCGAGSGTNAVVPSVPAGKTPIGGPAASRPSVQAMCPDARPGYYRCFALRRTDVWYAHPPNYKAAAGIGVADLASAASKGWYLPLGPAQLQQAYNLPSKTAGKGQTVGIVDAYDDPTAESDLAAFRKAFKLPACTTANGCFQKLNQDGAASPLPKADGGWSGEISLDLDMVSAICPNCHIVLIEAKSSSSTNLGIAVGAAFNAGARQISNSYGGP
jgi:hypothetical protein